MCSKSANYCYPSREKTTGLMLLSEVALGDMFELTQAQYMDQPPSVMLLLAFFFAVVANQLTPMMDYRDITAPKA